MHKPKSDIENKTNKILWDFEIHKDQPIPVRRSQLIFINSNKRICHLMDFAVPANHRVKDR